MKVRSSSRVRNNCKIIRQIKNEFHYTKYWCEHVFVDYFIINCEIHSHPPYAKTTLNNSDEIHISVETQDIYT